LAGILSRSISEPGSGVLPMTSMAGSVTLSCAEAGAANAAAVSAIVAASLLALRFTRHPVKPQRHTLRGAAAQRLTVKF